MRLTPNTKVLICGIAEPLAIAHVPLMRDYGTQVLAGVSPGEGGRSINEIPVFDLVEEAIATVGPIDVVIVFSPAYAAVDAALEAIAAGIRQVVMVSAGVPPLDMVRLVRRAEATDTLVLGPNCPGIIVPGQVLLGMHPAECYQPGSIGIVSRCSTLAYEVALQLTRAGFGQSIAACIGADRVVGSSLLQWLQMLDEDDRTEAIVLLGEVSGDGELRAARYIAETIDKPVIAYIAGHFAPVNRSIGHANQIVASRTELGKRGKTDVATKVAALKAAKVRVADRPSKIPELLQRALNTKAKAPSAKG
ncbi:MAG: CoA-binding protein [Limnothrix sp. CACIAM 69d]|nr:MAG: CoA-binding protein [Limnothrix sp. CACIAM 69d]